MMKGTKRGVSQEPGISKRPAPAPAVPKNSFSIFVDEKFAAENVQHKENQVPKAAAMSNPKPAAQSLARPSSTVRQPLAPAVSHHVTPSLAAAPDADNRKPENACYKPQALINASDGSEQCFEEYRIGLYLARQAEKDARSRAAQSQRQASSLVAQAMIDDSSSDRESDRAEDDTNTNDLLNGTMTINSRAAMAAVIGMWNSPLELNQKKSVIVNRPVVASGSTGSSANSSGGASGHSSAQSSGNISGTLSAAQQIQLQQSQQQIPVVSVPSVTAAPPQQTPSRVALQSLPVVPQVSATPSRVPLSTVPVPVPAVPSVVTAAPVATPSRQPLAPIPVITPQQQSAVRRQSVSPAFHPFDYIRFEAVIPATLRAALNVTDMTTRSAPAVNDKFILQDQEWAIGEKISSHVYLVQRVNDDKVEEDPNDILALKISTSIPLVWELYISNQISKRIPPTMAGRFAHHLHLTQFRDANFLLTTKNCQPSFLELGKMYEKGMSWAGDQIDEFVALFYAAELLRATEELHKCGIIHGNISPAHVMIVQDVSPNTPWKPGGWPELNLGAMLVDFTSAIDMTLFPKGHSFNVSAPGSMPLHQQLLPVAWNFHIDFISVAQTLFWLLNHSELQVVLDTITKTVKAVPGKRKLESAAVWDKLFESLLNIRTSPELHPSQLCEMRNAVENYLVQSGHGKRMKSLLHKQKIGIIEAQDAKKQ